METGRFLVKGSIMVYRTLLFSDHEKTSNKQFLVQFLIQSKEDKVNESHLLAPQALVKEWKKQIQF